MSSQEKDQNLLMDSCSTCNYIIQSEANEIGFQSLGKVMMRVKTFAMPIPKEMTCDVGYLHVQKLDGTWYQLAVAVIPDICGTIEIRALNASMKEKIKGYRLADTFPDKNETRKVTLLIGVACFWDLLGGEKIHIQDSLHLISSEFGWIISGAVSQSNEKGNCEDQIVFLSSAVSCTETNINIRVPPNMMIQEESDTVTELHRETVVPCESVRPVCSNTDRGNKNDVEVLSLRVMNCM